MESTGSLVSVRIAFITYSMNDAARLMNEDGGF